MLIILKHGIVIARLIEMFLLFLQKASLYASTYSKTARY